MMLLKYCSLRLWMNFVNQDQFSLGAFLFHFFANAGSVFRCSDFARIPHAAHFISAAALVRVGLDPLS